MRDGLCGNGCRVTAQAEFVGFSFGFGQCVRNGVELVAVNAELVLISIVAIERIFSRVATAYAARKRAKGGGLEKAYRQTGIVMDSLFQLYTELSGTPGFHSLRMISVHNSGADLSSTMLWKGTVLATYPHDADAKGRWDEHPLDPEYQMKVLRPVSEQGWRSLRRSELTPDGSLGVQYARLGIEHSLIFLVNKSDPEIVFASVSFNSSDMTPDQLDAIRSCEARISTKLKM